MLDSVKNIRAVDRKGMMSLIGKMPDHLSEGLRRGRRTGLSKFTSKNIVICGMGGSAIGGDLLKAWLTDSCAIPCEVIRSYAVPSYVGNDSLVIVASYSGNTEESLCMLEDARKKRSKIVSISSGGKLADVASASSIPHARIPTGLPPRATIGYMFGAMVGVVERVGAAKPDKQVEESERILAKISELCGPAVPTLDNPAKKIAHEMFGRIPVIVGHGASAPVAKRWANQLNENAKCLAFSSELPEMDHNEIVGYSSDPRGKGFSIVFLDKDAGEERMTDRIEATIDIVRCHAQAHSIESSGSSPMSRMLSLVMLGDYVSVYTAVLNKVDPSSTEPIERLKTILSKK
ncbi:MAG: bifunctional phosphoglucose/phosphomannose isomerase [Methanomassiliicoccus sp.]|nr:MAG: bifunctional phosphoglucose/phosphomannose isomerase [Methanomassiliicoccus sp.]